MPPRYKSKRHSVARPSKRKRKPQHLIRKGLHGSAWPCKLQGARVSFFVLSAGRASWFLGRLSPQVRKTGLGATTSPKVSEAQYQLLSNPCQEEKRKMSLSFWNHVYL